MSTVQLHDEIKGSRSGWHISVYVDEISSNHAKST